MAYHKTVPIAGNPAKAVEIMRDHFINAGFEITELTASRFKANAPAQRLNIPQSPLLKISWIAVEGAGGALTLDAKIGGAKSRTGVVSAFFWIAIFLSANLFYGRDLFHASAGAHGNLPYLDLLIPLAIGLVLWSAFLSTRRGAAQFLDTLAANAAKVAELK